MTEPFKLIVLGKQSVTCANFYTEEAAELTAKRLAESGISSFVVQDGGTRPAIVFDAVKKQGVDTLELKE